MAAYISKPWYAGIFNALKFDSFRKITDFKKRQFNFPSWAWLCCYWVRPNLGLICQIGIQNSHAKRSKSIKGPRNKVKTEVHTILERWSWRKERRREDGVPRQSGPEPSTEPPSYLFRVSDVTYANQADQVTRCYIFNFLRAHGEESSRGRTWEGGVFLEEVITVKNLMCCGFKDRFPQRWTNSIISRVKTPLMATVQFRCKWKCRKVGYRRLVSEGLWAQKAPWLGDIFKQSELLLIWWKSSRKNLMKQWFHTGKSGKKNTLGVTEFQCAKKRDKSPSEQKRAEKQRPCK